MAKTDAERAAEYRTRKREQLEAEAGLPPQAPKARYELAYGPDGAVIAWRLLGSPEWTLGSGPTRKQYDGPSVGQARAAQEGAQSAQEGGEAERESSPAEGLEHLEALREQMGRSAKG